MTAQTQGSSGLGQRWRQTSNERRIELGSATLLLLLMAGLVIGVQRWADMEGESVEPLQPITVFPDFAAIENVDVKKQQFFDYLQDYIAAENERLLALRAEVAQIRDAAAQGSLSPEHGARLEEISESYLVDVEEMSREALFATLMRRVDGLPPSLVLAQAATESAWGTSRFALEGNNLFGQWCYVEGCGLVPLRRIDGATHEVRSFDSVAGSVRGYFKNINTHPSYRHLRELREAMRRRAEPLDPIALANGLGRYSERGDSYVDEVQTLILQNGLRERDSG